MDETVAEYIRRTVLRIPRSETSKMLASWGFLSETQLQSLKIHYFKEKVSEAVVELCEVRANYKCFYVISLKISI